MFWPIFIFNKSKIYQKDISKRPPYFIFCKNMKISTSKLCRFSIHRNYIEKVHWNDVEFSPVKIVDWIVRPLNKVHRNDVDFSLIEITSKKACRNDWPGLKIILSLQHTILHQICWQKFTILRILEVISFHIHFSL